MNMIYLSESKLKILESLAKYKFLTTKQMLRLGIVKYRTNLVPLLKDLRERHRPLIAKISFAVHPKYGRLEDVYYLTKWGVKFLVENLDYEKENIRYPIGTSSLFFRDYFHRLFTIDFHIEYEKWANENDYEVLFFHTYFDKVGANRSKTKKRLEALTKIELNDGKDYIIADAISMFQTPKRKYLFSLEVYNGKDTKRIIKQLKKHIIALSEGKPSLQYNFKRGSKVIVLFELENTMKAVIERLNQDEDFEEFENYFLFKTVGKLKETFFNQWFNIKFKEITFF